MKPSVLHDKFCDIIEMLTSILNTVQPSECIVKSDDLSQLEGRRKKAVVISVAPRAGFTICFTVPASERRLLAPLYEALDTLKPGNRGWGATTTGSIVPLMTSYIEWYTRVLGDDTVALCIEVSNDVCLYPHPKLIAFVLQLVRGLQKVIEGVCLR